MKLKNEKYANSALVSSFGLLKFDEQGILQNELDTQSIEALSQLKGFSLVEVEAPKAVKKEVEPEDFEQEQPEVEQDEELEKPKPNKRGAHLNKGKKK